MRSVNRNVMQPNRVHLVPRSRQFQLGPSGRTSLAGLLFSNLVKVRWAEDHDIRGFPSGTQAWRAFRLFDGPFLSVLPRIECTADRPLLPSRFAGLQSVAVDHGDDPRWLPSFERSAKEVAFTDGAARWVGALEVRLNERDRSGGSVWIAEPGRVALNRPCDTAGRGGWYASPLSCWF